MTQAEHDIRTRIYTKTFGLNAAEELINDFSCALVKSMVLVQGRLYISSKYLCFFSTLLGGEKIVISMDDVSSIQKERTALIFSNAIHVHLKNETSYFFTSLIRRDQCFDTLSRVINDLTLEDLETIDLPVVSSLDSSPGTPSPCDTLTDQPSVDAINLSLSDRESPYKLDISWEHLKTFSLPVSAVEFVATYVHPETPYFLSQSKGTFTFVQFHLLRGDRTLEMSAWMVCDIGFTQRIEFTADVLDGGPFVPKSTRVVMDVFYKVVDDNIVIVRQSESLDMPYSDCFKVYEKWEIINSSKESPSITVRVYYGLKFSKSVVWKPIILRKSREETCRGLHLWLTHVCSLSDTTKKPALYDSTVSGGVSRNDMHTTESFSRYLHGFLERWFLHGLVGTSWFKYEWSWAIWAFLGSICIGTLLYFVDHAASVNSLISRDRYIDSMILERLGSLPQLDSNSVMERLLWELKKEVLEFDSLSDGSQSVSDIRKQILEKLFNILY